MSTSPISSCSPYACTRCCSNFGNFLLEARVGVNDVPALAGDVGHHAAPNRSKILRTIWLSARSTPNRYRPKNRGRQNDDHRRGVDFTPRRPRHPLHLVANFGEERAARLRPRAAERRSKTPAVRCVALRRVFLRVAMLAASSTSARIVAPSSLPRFTDWQARRDSNPQRPVLETGALPIEPLAFGRRSSHVA